MADSVAAMALRDEHHKKCMDALIKIAKLTRGHSDRSSAGFPYESMSQILYRTGSVMCQIESIAKEITGWGWMEREQ